jgi:hypothetical protein
MLPLVPYFFLCVEQSRQADREVSWTENTLHGFVRSERGLVPSGFEHSRETLVSALRHQFAADFLRLGCQVRPLIYSASLSWTVHPQDVPLCEAVPH